LNHAILPITLSHLQDSSLPQNRLVISLFYKDTKFCGYMQVFSNFSIKILFAGKIAGCVPAIIQNVILKISPRSYLSPITGDPEDK
jgi:hypothetical protein